MVANKPTAFNEAELRQILQLVLHTDDPNAIHTEDSWSFTRRKFTVVNWYLGLHGHTEQHRLLLLSKTGLGQGAGWQGVFRVLQAAPPRTTRATGMTT